jgi:RNA recognition motif-containing protein
MNIYVSNVGFNMLDKDLKDIFLEYGEVSSAKIVLDRMTMRSRGFGFVEMKDDEASKKAIAALDGTTIDGRTIKVTEARQKEERSPYRTGADTNYNNSRSYNKNRY